MNEEEKPQKEPQHLSALATIARLEKESPQLPVDFVGKIGDGNCPIPIPASITTANSLNEILVFARKNNATDVHLCINNPVIFRKATSLVSQSPDKLSPERMEKIMTEVLNSQQLSEFHQYGDLEFVYTLSGAGRFRVTLMKQRLGWDFTARLIPTEIRSFKDSGMPPACAQLTKWAQGLILITGPTSCGKTSTLSTLVEMINQTRSCHIITIEDPIEIIYTPKMCQITQREIRMHSISQATSLKAALREDPDIIVVSELRDLDSIQLAVTAAETGHLVLGTMNTLNASQTISRVIDSFPPEEQAVIRSMVSESLRGVICQQLIPTKDGSDVVIAYEVLLANSAIANLIREAKFNQISNSITAGRNAGMVILDDSLQELVNKNIISGTEAYYRASSRNIFAQHLTAENNADSKGEAVG